MAITTFAPLNEKHFCLLAELFKGSLNLVFIFRKLRVALTVFLVKILQRYLGAILLPHLKTVRYTCLLINSSIVFQPKLWVRGFVGASKMTVGHDAYCSVLESLQL